MSDENNRSGWRQFFKVLGIITAVLLLIVAIGFGLLVGACATMKR